MGRWMQKVQKSGGEAPPKPTKPSSVGFVGSPSPCFQITQAANEPLSPQQVGWLSAVASLLGVGTGHLVSGGFIDRFDLEEQLDSDPGQVASLIRSEPGWYHKRSGSN